MKKLAHYLDLRTFQYPSEDPDKVKESVNTILDLDSEGLNGELQEESLESYEGAEIKKYTYETENWSKVKEVVKRIFREIEEPKNLEKHLTDDGDFYIRLSKQEAYKGNMKFSESGDVIHVKVKIASYPFKMEKVKKNLKKLIESD